MLTFLLDNIGTIVVLLIVVAVVAAIIISHFRAKKKGKSSCGSRVLATGFFPWGNGR